MRVFYYFNPSESVDPEPDYKILDNILTCKRIKLSKISKANDPTEFQYSFSEDTPQKNIEDFREAFTKIDERFGYISFSEKRDIVLMWSHYAVGHTGFALEIEMPKSFLKKVVYSTQAPEIVILNAALSDKIISGDYFYNIIMSTKSLCWAYEREWRMIVSFNHPLKGIEIQTEDHATGDGRHEIFHFYKFPPKALKSVFMGVKCKMEEEVLREKLKETNLEHVNVYKFKLACNGFEIECPRYRKERLKSLISKLRFERNAHAPSPELPKGISSHEQEK